MKNIIQKFKNWLIKLLGGYTQYDMNVKDAEANQAVNRACAEVIALWVKAVQEICRKSDNTYYSFCCEYCATPCKKRNGWCEGFWPSAEKKQWGYTGR